MGSQVIVLPAVLLEHAVVNEVESNVTVLLRTGQHLGQEVGDVHLESHRAQIATKAGHLWNREEEVSHTGLQRLEQECWIDTKDSTQVVQAETHMLFKLPVASICKHDKPGQH